MSNKFKLKKKLVSIALALALAAQPLASFPMNVFAGTGKNGVMVAPTITYSFDLDNIIELAANTKFDVAAHAKNITPQGATVNYTVESQTVFSNNANDAVFGADGNVKNPGIAKIKVKVGDVSKDTYIIADINGILTAAYAAASDAAADPNVNNAYYAAYCAVNAAHYAAQSDEFFDAYVGHSAAFSLDLAADGAGILDSKIGDNAAAYTADDAAKAAGGVGNSAKEGAPFPDLTADWVANNAAATAWANSYNNSVGGIIDKLKEAYAKDKTEVQKKWLVAAYGMAKVAAHIVAQRLSEKGLDLEARLKVVYACYRVAEAVWTELGNNQANLDACQAKADALQQMIDKVYADKVGDIEAQAKKA